MIFNAVQFPGLVGDFDASQQRTTVLPLPDDEATKTFQEAYGRPQEMPKATERQVELPAATPETLAKVVAENLTLSKELPRPIELPKAVEQPKDVESPKVVEQPKLVELPKAVTRPDELSTEDDVTLQAMPDAVAGFQSVRTVEGPSDIVPVAGVAAKVSTEVPRTASDIVLEAASAVADVLLVTPNLMRGEGEIVVQLKPDVLDGSRLRIQVAGNVMQVEFEPVTDEVSRLLTNAQPQLERQLTERMPTLEFAVTVLPGSSSGRRLARKSVERFGGEA